MCIIVDGIDQAKMNLPYTKVIAKSTSSLYTVLLKVQVNFLPFGHTHEDVDQLFSKISAEIRRAGAESIPGLFCERSKTENYCRSGPVKFD